MSFSWERRQDPPTTKCISVDPRPEFHTLLRQASPLTGVCYLWRQLKFRLLSVLHTRYMYVKRVREVCQDQLTQEIEFDN